MPTAASMPTMMTTISSINVNDLDKDFGGEIKTLLYIPLVYPPP